MKFGIEAQVTLLINVGQEKNRVTRPHTLLYLTLPNLTSLPRIKLIFYSSKLEQNDFQKISYPTLTYITILILLFLATLKVKLE